MQEKRNVSHLDEHLSLKLPRNEDVLTNNKFLMFSQVPLQIEERGSSDQNETHIEMLSHQNRKNPFLYFFWILLFNLFFIFLPLSFNLSAIDLFPFD